jgi:hypothetical protein
MDPEDAILLLSDGIPPNLGGEALLLELERHGQALVDAVKDPEGPSLTWQSAVSLMAAAANTDLGAEGFYSHFGWPTTSNAVQSGLKSKRVLQAVAFASEPFVPPALTAEVFKHPLVLDGITRGLQANPQPFIQPGDLAAAAQSTQSGFVRLLSALEKVGADTELRLQWSACCLRVLTSNPETHRDSARHFLQALLDDQRVIMVYYAFRALADQHPDLWSDSQAVKILAAFVQYCVSKDALRTNELVQLATDEELRRRCARQFSLSAIVGAMGVYLVRELRRDEGQVPMWFFFDQLQDDYPKLALAWSGFSSHGILPPPPPTYSSRIRYLRTELTEALKGAQTELRARLYDQLPLAIQIYQQNVKGVFQPLLEAIESGTRPDLILERIISVDPAELVTKNELQKTSRFPIEGKMLRKMISDNRRILQCLETAAEIQAALQNTLTELCMEPNDRFDILDEFSLFTQEIGETAVMALQQLLPSLWQRLQTNTHMMEAEREELYALEADQW